MTQLMPVLLTVFLQTEPQGSTPVWLPILIIVILLLFLWWGLTRNSIPEGSSDHGHDDHAHDTHGHDDHGHDDHGPVVTEEVPHHTEAVMEPEVETKAPPVAPTPPVATEPDDLKRIEGIGPKIESVLHAAGIITFSQVATTSVDDLVRIVKTEGGVRLAFPDSWPEQAALAANGEWEALDKLQDALDGGRKK